jgi:Na+-driven multidrug efflux pump
VIRPAGTDRDLDRRIAALALPALGAIAAEPAYSLADTAIVGHLGRDPLGALAIATTALNLTAWLAIFLSTATTSAVAGLAAGREGGRASRSAGAAYLVAAGGGTLIAATCGRPPRGCRSCTCRTRATGTWSGWPTRAPRCASRSAPTC